MAIPSMLAGIGNFIAMTASRVVASFVAKKINDTGKNNKNSNSQQKSSGSSSQIQLVKQNERSSQAEIEYLKGKARREVELLKIQADQAQMREIEIKAGMQIAAAHAEREERALDISEKALQLKRQELDIAKANLLQQGKIAEEQQKQVDKALQLREKELQLIAEELTEKSKLGSIYLDIMRDQNAKAIDLKLAEIQAIWDKDNWSGILSRAEMQKMLLDSRETHRLLMLISPPDIEGCSSFGVGLTKAVRSEVKGFLEKYYPINSDVSPVEFYGKFFKSSVFDVEVKQYEQYLAPIPTVIIYSDITPKMVYFHVYFWGCQEPTPLTLEPWHWLDAKRNLESEGKTEVEAIEIIEDSIVKIHQLLAALFADLYYLNVNPLYQPISLEIENVFPLEWLNNFHGLQELQQQKLNLLLQRGTMSNNQDARVFVSNPDGGGNVVNLSDELPQRQNDRLPNKVKADSEKIESGPPDIYKLATTEIVRDQKKLISKCSIGKPSYPSKPEKILMIVGATGAGKSTLINGMINYILGVEWQDDFRFKLIVDEVGKSQAHSQTKLITAYTIYSMEGSRLPYTITIIDTPGFGDTEGLQRDKFITQQIKEFFSMKNGIDHLDGIGFVTQAPLARLTPTQQYIFDSILSIFGNDVAKNIFIMVTFADGQKPPVMDALEQAKIPFSSSSKFNNSALFAKNQTDENEDEDDNFDAMFWKMGFSSFKRFFTEFAKAKSVSLQLTKDVLKERQQLEAIIQGIQPKIDAGLAKMEELRQEEKILDQRKSEIEQSKNFNYQIDVPKIKKISLSRGEYVTNCQICNCTCHFPCGIPDDGAKFNCAAMTGNRENATCGVCGCHWTHHRNNDFRFETYSVKETRTSDNLKKRFDTAVQGKNKVESMIANMNSTIEAIAEEVFSMIQQVQRSLVRLDQIALRPDPLTQEEHLNLLIEAEKREKRDGWKQRVAYYEEAKKQAKLLSQVQDKNIQKGNFRAWVENLRFW